MSLSTAYYELQRRGQRKASAKKEAQRIRVVRQAREEMAKRERAKADSRGSETDRSGSGMDRSESRSDSHTGDGGSGSGKEGSESQSDSHTGDGSSGSGMDRSESRSDSHTEDGGESASTDDRRMKDPSADNEDGDIIVEEASEYGSVDDIDSASADDDEGGGSSKGANDHASAAGDEETSDSDENDLDYEELMRILKVIQESTESESNAVLDSVKANQERFERVKNLLLKHRNRNKSRRHAREAPIIVDIHHPEPDGVLSVEDETKRRMMFAAVHRSVWSDAQRYLQSTFKKITQDIVLMLVTLCCFEIRHLRWKQTDKVVDYAIRKIHKYMMIWARDISAVEDVGAPKENLNLAAERTSISFMQVSVRNKLQGIQDEYLRNTENAELNIREITYLMIRMCFDVIQSIDGGIENRSKLQYELETCQKHLLQWADKVAHKAPLLARKTKVTDDSSADTPEADSAKTWYGWRGWGW